MAQVTEFRLLCNVYFMSLHNLIVPSRTRRFHAPPSNKAVSYFPTITQTTRVPQNTYLVCTECTVRGLLHVQQYKLHCTCSNINCTARAAYLTEVDTSTHYELKAIHYFVLLHVLASTFTVLAVADPGGVYRVQVNPPLSDIARVLFEFNTMLFTFKICLGLLLKLAKAS